LNTYQITVNGQQYTVEIEDLNASPVLVQIDGKRFEVVVTDSGAPRASARSVQSDVSDLAMDAYVPAVAATYQDIDLDEGGGQADAPAAAPQAAAERATTVSAPMPGTILDIAVKVGDRVAQGDTLCNLEAMKMKSPIRSPGEGAIVQVLIGEGQNVAFGDVLFTLN
jgi:biotin carboxyl carrier protein